MRSDPLSSSGIAHIRLYGLNEKEFGYRYTYSQQELETLAEKLTALKKEKDIVYCMFNNEGMYENLETLSKILKT